MIDPFDHRGGTVCMRNSFGRECLVMFAIYERPLNFVVRPWLIDGMPRPLEGHKLAYTLAGARSLMPRGLTRLPRDPFDDPAIIEVWV